MARIDETQEAIARIRMIVDENDMAQRDIDVDIEDDLADVAEHTLLADEDSIQGRHWSFGSPYKAITSTDLQLVEQSFKGDKNFDGFDTKLRNFFVDAAPTLPITFENTVNVSKFNRQPPFKILNRDILDITLSICSYQLSVYWGLVGG